MNKFMPATRHKIPLKLALTGPTGSVKTYSALLLAAGLANGGKIAFLDTENNSASLYADLAKFDVLGIGPPFTETKFVDAIHVAEQAGYTVLIIDSLSHAWQGVLDYKAGLDARGGNSYVNWNKAGSKFNDLLSTLLQSKIHTIVCMRSKMDYVLEPDSRGKMVPRKVGLAPIMREGIEFEFSTVFDGDLEHFVTVSKDRTGLFVDQRFQITEETGQKLLAWLNSAPEPASTPTPEPAPEPGPTVQEQLQKALYGIHEDWVTRFLVNHHRLQAGQSILDLPVSYCESALARVSDFRAAVVKFGQRTEQIPGLESASAPSGQPQPGVATSLDPSGNSDGAQAGASPVPPVNIVGGGADSLQAQLAAALTDVDPEILRLFLINRQVCADGQIQSVPDDYATKVLEHLPQFRQRLEKFAQEPF